MKARERVSGRPQRVIRRARLAEFRRTMESEAEERIERIKREKAEFEEKLRKQNEAEIFAMEQEHQRELENQRIEGERKLKARKEVSCSFS